jgi:MAP3K TRAFs-binding domain
MVDFDAVYRDLIMPAIEEAGMEPLRADEEMTGGIIHKPMFERLILCEYAVGDLTTANANVFYELGVRHAVRPWSTVLLYAGSSRLPFDVAPLRALPYKLSSSGLPDDLAKCRAELVKRLKEAQDSVTQSGAATDSPIYQLVEGFPEIDHTKTDVFRDRVQYSAEIKARLAKARKQGVDAIRGIEKEIEPIAQQESGVVVDLLLSYRTVEAWEDMVALARRMTAPLAATVMVQEQLALALNRSGQGEEAEKALLALLERRGPSSETYGILGRVYKDQWEGALRRGDEFEGRSLLDKAISAYLRGFEADWRDAYPGVNAVTLMTLRNPLDARRDQLCPVVSYAVERHIATGKPDYWDYAMRLELAVLAKDEQQAMVAIGDALTSVREKWEPQTTARNLRLIREVREQRGGIEPWMKQVEDLLEQKTRS